MAKKKKEAKKCYELRDGLIIMMESDIPNLTKEDRAIIEFYHNTLHYEMCFVEPEPKVKHYFTYDKAKAYLKKHKEDSKEFDAIREQADKLSKDYQKLDADKKTKELRQEIVKAQGDAFRKQKQWFKDKYGIDAYNEVKMM